MATDIPAFVSQIFLTSSDDGITGSAGTATMSTARWYYLVSNRTAASNGQSLLYALKTALDSATAATWTVTLSATTFKIQLSHNSGSNKEITFESATLATALGFTAATFTVNTATTVTATNLSYFWWSPGMPISGTGPQPWDPAISYGVPHSVGNAQRAPDQTAAYVSNGVLYDAEIMFNGVQDYYTIRPQSGHTNKDLETWWNNGPRKGRRVLMWRDRADATGSNAPGEGSATPYNYVQYYPAPELQMNFPAVPTAPPNLYYHDVKLSLWLTEDGETPLSD